MAVPIFGVDVSRHQGTLLNWPRIRASGIEFMIARASLATTPDPTFKSNLERARHAGIPVLGGYHFLYPASVVSPAAQARLFVRQLGNANGLLTVLDVEKDRSPTTRQVFEPKIADIRAFAREFARLTDGHPLIIYGPAWYWTGHIGNPAADDLGVLHASRYVPVAKDARGRIVRMTPAEAFAKVPAGWWRARHGGWTKATILQFTSSGKVAGYGGRIDLNAFRGSTAALRRLTVRGGPEPHPAGPPPARPDSSQGRPATRPGSRPSARHRPSSPGTMPRSEPRSRPRFHVVVHGDTLAAIAAAHGFKARGGRPAFRVMIEAFTENARYRANPNLIHPGDRVRIR